MQSREKTVLGPVKKMIFIVAIAIFSISVSFTYLIYQSNMEDYRNNVIINVFGKQRMLTQEMAKNANLLYSFYRTLESGDSSQTKDSLEAKKSEVRTELNKARQGFEETLSAMHRGALINEENEINIRASIEKSLLHLKNIDDTWVGFKEKISIIQNSTAAKDMEASLAYINDNNEKLLRYCDIITQAVVEESVTSAKQKENVAIALVALSILIIIISLFNLLKYIIMPFNELYKGIAENGLSKLKPKSSIPTKQELAPVVGEIHDLFQKIDYLISLMENMNKNSSFNGTLEFIKSSFAAFIPFAYIGIALISPDKKMLVASYGVSDGTITGLPQNLAGKPYSVEGTSLSVLIESGKSRIINDLEEYTAGKPLSEYNDILLHAGVKASIAVPLKVSSEPVGMIFFSSNKKNVYNEEHIKLLEMLANSIAISLDRNIFVNDLLYSSILALAKLAEARDEDTGEHLDRMKAYSKAIAQALYESDMFREDINQEYIDNIERFSPMHDIGKVGIRDGILMKPGKLSPEEFEEMKKHTTNGAEVLKAAESNIAKRGRSLFSLGIEITECHHEKWDGSGYPNGLKGRDIPLSARIVAIADVFDALTSRRPYKEPFSFEESFKIVESGSGRHFDPEIIKVFSGNRSILEGIYSGFRPNNNITA